MCFDFGAETKFNQLLYQVKQQKFVLASFLGLEQNADVLWINYLSSNLLDCMRVNTGLSQVQYAFKKRIYCLALLPTIVWTFLAQYVFKFTENYLKGLFKKLTRKVGINETFCLLKRRHHVDDC